MDMTIPMAMRSTPTVTAWQACQRQAEVTLPAGAPAVDEPPGKGRVPQHSELGG